MCKIIQHKEGGIQGPQILVFHLSSDPPGSLRSHVAPGQWLAETVQIQYFLRRTKLPMSSSSHPPQHPQGHAGRLCDLMKGNREEKKRNSLAR